MTTMTTHITVRCSDDYHGICSCSDDYHGMCSCSGDYHVSYVCHITQLYVYHYV